MIDPRYVSMMSRYNAWQNKQLTDILAHMDEADLIQDRGAFFGSILATLNHILWGDSMWMSRFSDQFDPPSISAAQHKEFTATSKDWAVARADMDSRLIAWADTLGDADLQGDLTWYSGMTQQELSRPFQDCVVHLFNHQIHHRGQVHAMLTAAGQEAPVSDMVFMPETA